MAGQTITRAHLVDAVYRKVGLSRTESSQLVELMLQEMLEALERGENLKMSSFGSFVLRDKNERVGRNPKTGVEAVIKPRRVMVFRASPVMKDRVNGLDGESEDA